MVNKKKLQKIAIGISRTNVRGNFKSIEISKKRIQEIKGQIESIFSSIANLKEEVKKSGEELSNILDQKLLILKSAAAEYKNASLERLGELSAEIDDIKKDIKEVSQRKVEIPNFDNQIKKVESELSKVTSANDLKNTKKKVEELVEELKKLRRDTMSAMASKGGGNMNRNILVANNPSTLGRYTDLNLITGSNIGLIYANNDTLKTTDLTIATTNPITFTNILTPSTPVASSLGIYSKNDGSGTSALYFLDDAGLETKVGAGGGGGVTTFLALTDTPASYAGAGLNLVRVNTGGTALEFISAVPVAQGGTNLASYAIGDLLYASAATTLAKLAIGATSKFLTVTAGLPAWGDAVDLTTNQTISAGIKTFTVLPQSSANPSAGADLTTKTYVDTLLSTGARFIDAVNAATTAALVSNVYNNGTSGVGATLTGSANGAFETVDGVAAALNNLYLIKNEAAGANNGYYKLTTLGDAGTKYVLTRQTAYDQSAEIVAGTFFNILSGTTNGNTQWALTTQGTITVGTTSLTFSQLSAPTVYTASLGVKKVSNDFRADFVSNDGLKLSTNSLTVAYDDSSIGIVANLLAVKALGITNAMLAGSIADSKLSQIVTASKVSGAALTSLSSIPAGAGVMPTANEGSGVADATTFLRGDQTWATPAGTGAGVTTLSYTKMQDTNVTAVTVSNTAVETTIYSYSVPANTLGTNKALRFTLNGTYTNNSGANKTVTVRVKYGATTLLTKATGNIGTSATAGSFAIEGFLASQGATNVQEAYMYASFESGLNTSVDMTDRGVAAINSTLAQTFVITVQFSAATATQTLVFRFGTLELINASDTLGAPTDASYLTLANNGNLSAERVLTGTTNQIVLTDNGANSTLVLSLGTNAVLLDSVQTLTNKTLTTPIINQINASANTSIKLNAGSYDGIQTYTPAAGGTATLDLSLGNTHHITMPAGNITIALSNVTTGQCFIVRILQDGVGSRTVTWFTTIKWAGGSAPTLTTTANKVDTLGFEVTGTNTYDGFIVGQNV